MKIIQNLADPSRYSIKCPYAMTPTRVVVHNTANDAPAANEIAYMIRNDNEVSFHYAVDDQEVVQGVPETGTPGTPETETAKATGRGSPWKSAIPCQAARSSPRQSRTPLSLSLLS